MTATPDDAARELERVEKIERAKPEGDWIKLERGNNWGRMFLKIDDESGPLAFQDGEFVDVRFPYGTIQTNSIVMEEVTHHVGAKEHERCVVSQLPYVRVLLFGYEHSIAIDKLQVRREWAQAHVVGSQQS